MTSWALDGERSTVTIAVFTVRVGRDGHTAVEPVERWLDLDTAVDVLGCE